MQIGHVAVSDREFRALCETWKVAHLAVFGSVLRPDFGPESDIDFLVEFDPNADWSLMDLVRAEEEFGALFGRPVQLVERTGLLKSQNRLRRDAILGSAKVIHAA